MTNAGIHIVDGGNLQRIEFCAGLSDKRDIFFVGYDKVLIAVIARLEEICGICPERGRNSIRSYGHNIHIRILGILIILIIKAVVLICSLCSNNGQAHTSRSCILIFVAGGF